jgi:superfamily I DNA/RNA helicase
MQFSPEQERIFLELIENRGALNPVKVVATAGSGKSTTCAQAAKRLRLAYPDVEIAYTTFAKKNVGDIESKLEEAKGQIDVLTCNSMGARDLSKALTPRPRLDPKKVRSIVKDLYGNTASFKSLSAITSGVSFAKAHLLSHTNPLQDFRDVLAHQECWAEEFSLGDLAAMVRGALTRNNQERAVIDFDDQIYFPSLLDVTPMKRWGFLFVDEFQDLTYAQLRLVLRHLSKNGRLIAIGDPMQAIYGWRGAHNSVFQEVDKYFGSSLPSIELPLSVSFRCATKVCELAAKTGSPIVAHENNPAGEVEVTVKAPPMEDFISGGAGMMVLCRNNMPLLNYAVQMMREKVPFNYVGRDFGVGLKQVITQGEKMADDGEYNDPMEGALAILVARRRTAERRGDEQAIERIQDQIDSCEFLWEEVSTHEPNEGYRVEAFKDLCDDLFRSGNGVSLSTVHRAKGLEAEHVVIISPELMVPRSSTKSWKYREEMNVIFVAVTRALNKLTIVDVTEVCDSDGVFWTEEFNEAG